jgi:hypothetical protein
MKLIVKGTEGRRVVDWESYALLRDNVQHFVEHGTPNGRFWALHGIETAVDVGNCVGDAARLRGEVLRAVAALQWIPLQSAAVSERTRAIMRGSVQGPAEGPTVPADEAACELPISENSSTMVPSAARSFVDAVLSLTEQAQDGDWLEIRRAGDGPTFTRGDDSRK